jgi:catechol 2,3-dioxygenase-like lactoylglutathione lyase family enzyme
MLAMTIVTMLAVSSALPVGEEARSRGPFARHAKSRQLLGSSSEVHLSRRALIASAPLVALPLHVSAASSPQSPVHLLHAVLNVPDLEASARFFKDAYGLTRTRSRPGNEFVAFGDESRGAHFAIELSPLAAGTTTTSPGFGGFVLAVDNPAKAAARAISAGARRAGGGKRCSGDAFAGCAVAGPDGTPVAFVKGDSKAPRLARTILFVPDVAAAAAVYEKALGFQKVSRQQGVVDRAAEDGTRPPSVLLGRGDGGTLIELRAAASSNIPADTPQLFDKIALSVPTGELATFADAVGSNGGVVVKPPFAVPGIGTRVAIVSVGNTTLALVDADDFEKELS